MPRVSCESNPRNLIAKHHVVWDRLNTTVMLAEDNGRKRLFKKLVNLGERIERKGVGPLLLEICMGRNCPNIRFGGYKKHPFFPVSSDELEELSKSKSYETKLVFCPKCTGNL